MAWESSPNDPHAHCYFKRQPDEPWELKQALAAINASCCGAIYYAGSDPEVLRAVAGQYRDQGKFDDAIATLQALNRHAVRAFNSDRKGTHWGRRKLKRDE